jgi:sRNA-binding protein
MPVHTIREDRDRCIQALAGAYPRTFFIVGERRKPLKIGIARDIEADLAKDNDHVLLDYDVVDAIAFYENHIGTLKNTTTGANRLDLHGKAAGKVTLTEAREAAAVAEEAIARMNARRQEQPTGNGLPAFVAQPPAPPKVSTIQVNGALSTSELFVELEKHLKLVRTVLDADPDDTLRKQLARSALTLMADEVRTIIARLD